MTEKKIDIYADAFMEIDINNTRLIIELGSNYTILAALDTAGKKVLAYEYFEFDAANNTLNNIFGEVKLLSKVLTNRYSAAYLFYNFPEVLVVPSLYDNEDNAKMYLNTFYNSLKTSVIESDKLAAFDNISVIYSVEETIKREVESAFSPASAYHSYSKLLQNIAQAFSGNNGQCFHLFFYNQMFVLVLTGEARLKFVKSVNYHSANDALYFILNVAKQYNVNTEQIQLKISGFINYDSEEYIVLQKYFANIVMEGPPVLKPINGLFEGFPQQYFTPFFYLLA